MGDGALEQHMIRPPAWYEPPSESPVQCSGPCCTVRKAPDDMVTIFGSDEVFCGERCLEEWISEHLPEVIRRLRL